MKTNPTILIIEDDIDLTTYLREFLTDQRYTVHLAHSGSKALKTLEKVIPDIVLLDLNLPDISGESLLERIKKYYSEIPIIILTAKDNPQDIVRNLNDGADDYLTKPFSSEELLARIKARLRKSNKAETEYSAADVVLNTETMEVKKNGELIDLTQTEFTLLHYLLVNKNKVLTREMILSHVWAYSPETETRVVDVYIGYLRKKIDNGSALKIIHSARGFGYSVKG